MAFVPNSRVYLLDTPLDNTYKNQLHFESIADQHAFFVGCIKHSYEGVTFQRKDNTIMVNNHIDYLWDCNCVMYQNTQYGEKWFYAFIVKMEYVSDSVTRIYIETDVYQTWLFNCVLKDSFVVREHVADDTIGKHLVDEKIDTGEYIMTSYDPSLQIGDNWNILGVSDNTPIGSEELVGNIYGNVVTGLTYYPFPNDADGVAWLKSTIGAYTTAGKIEAIEMIFTVPELVIENTIHNPLWELGAPIVSGELFGVNTFNVAKQVTTVDGYTPKNNKLFTYPYKFLYASNNDGLSAQYRYEDFPNNNMSFSVLGSVMPNPRVLLAPNDYRGEGLKYEYGLVLTGFPMCSWSTDTYAAWLAQNSVPAAVSLVGGVGAFVGGVATGNPLAIGGGALAIMNEVGQIYKASIQPDQAKGQVGSGALMFGIFANDFYFAHMTIKQEFAKRIDQFFSMFGYKVNTLKVPEIHSRESWNYIQTIDVNIDGSLPAEDMQRLKRVYNEGVTLWHTTTGFLDYSLSNDII